MTEAFTPSRASFIAIKSLIVSFPLTSQQAKRITKSVLSSVTVFAFIVITKVNNVTGIAPYLLCIATVNSFPGRRLGSNIESVVLSLAGLAVGLAYGIFTHHFAFVIQEHSDTETALAFMAVMEVIMLFISGFIRSLVPRLFQLSFIFFVMVHFIAMEPLEIPLNKVGYGFTIPFLLAFGTSLFFNLAVFPEFGSTYIGSTVVDALNEVHSGLNSSVKFFLEPSQALSGSAVVESILNNPPTVAPPTIGLLTAQKAKIRSKLATCKAVMMECIYEISYAFMSPRELKPIVKKINSLSSTLNAVIGACELEYALIGDSSQALSSHGSTSGPGNENDSESSSESEDGPGGINLDSFKPQKEIEFADKDTLLTFLNSVHDPILNLAHALSESLNLVKKSIAFGYDVPLKEITLLESPHPLETKSGKRSLHQYEVSVEVLAPRVEQLLSAITAFDLAAPAALNQFSKASMNRESNVDLMPRDELFLISSFLLNFRECTSTVHDLLSDARDIVETRTRRQSRGWFGRKIWLSHLASRKRLLQFLSTGYDERKEGDVASINEVQASENIRKTAEDRSKPSDAFLHFTQPEYISSKFTPIRIAIADTLEATMKYKRHIQYGLKMSVLLMIVSFPAFTVDLRDWYLSIRGTWVGFGAVLVLESSVGGTFLNAIVRAVGLTFGSAWGYAAYSAGNGHNFYVMAVVLAVGLFPMYYVLIVTKYSKSGFVGIVSCLIVIASTVHPAIPGTILQNFTRRCVTMLIGSSMALVIQVGLFPIRARDLLFEHVITSVRLCQHLEGHIAVGADDQDSPHLDSFEGQQRFKKLSKNARTSLVVANNYREYLHSIVLALLTKLDSQKESLG